MRELASKPRMGMILVLALSALCGLPSLARAQFGFASLTSSVSNDQAGAHADFSTAFTLDTEALGNPVAPLKDVKVALPPGLSGNPQAIERCTIKTFEQLNCAAGSQVGVLEVTAITCQGVSTALTVPAGVGDTTITVASTGKFCSEQNNNTITIGSGAEAETATIEALAGPSTLRLSAPLKNAHSAGEAVAHVAAASTLPIPLFNLEPTAGHVATFGASLLFTEMVVQVDADKQGRLTATIEYVSTFLSMEGTTLTLWGDPADPTHNGLRCAEFGSECERPDTAPAVAFLTNPTNCSGALQSEVVASSWEGQSVTGDPSLPTMTGCEALTMSPALTVTPGTTQRDEPSDYEIDLKTPQSSEPEGLATAAVQSASFKFPLGTSLSPSLANGLQSCSPQQASEDSCPNASKVGTSEILSPVLAAPLQGGVYIGTPTPAEKYPLIVSLTSGSVNLILHAQVDPDESSGQPTVNFKELPQLPFTDFKLNLFGGPTAPAANPLTCGAATSTAQISSYSGLTANPSSTFTVDADGHGGACPASVPFAPSLSAGSTNPLAASFSPFSLSVSREDGQQDISSFTAQLPAGLVGLLQSVPLCPEPQASEGACGPASQAGTAAIAAGAGTLPLRESGSVYLTGPYDGAPFGLAVVIDAVAGPFDLGRLDVRSRIFINPTNLTLTVATDPFPQILSGIPLRLRTVNLTLDRPNFIVNPTDCAAQAVTATVESVQGTQALASSPFQISGCQALPFAPRLSAISSSKASLRGSGASLSMTVGNPAGAAAAIRSMLIQLPPQLRPRLSTIQKACLQNNTALVASTCSEDSLVGHASVSSPITAAPLTGPIYLIAHGGATLPSLLLMVHGGGIAATLEGSLDISRQGVLTASFGQLPDVPLNSLQLEFPRGRFSMFGAIRGLCSSALNMPYAMTGQNGAQVKRTLRVGVHGCPKRDAHKKATKASRRRRADSLRRI